MLLSFSATNFRSVKHLIKLDMAKTSLKGFSNHYFQADKKLSLLKSVALYGPNASGKSNLLRAIKALEFMVRFSSSFKPNEKISPYEPHRLDQLFAKAPTAFDIEFISQGTRYEYSIAFTALQIEREELNYYPKGTKTLLFSRHKGKDIRYGDAYKGARKQIERLLLDNQLFLSKAAENNVEPLLPVFKFFTEGLMIFPFLDEYRENNLGRLYIHRLAEAPSSVFSKKFNSLICALDTGIDGVSAEEIDWNNHTFPNSFPDEVKQQVKEAFKYDVKTQHKVFKGNQHIGNENFSLEDESTGTKSLFVMAGIILDALDAGRVLVIDEFEKNLHSSITQYLIRLFHNPVTNPNNAQLIFSTHDITQLSYDNFRRDQLHFVEKDEQGATQIQPCASIGGIRLNAPLDKWYASGRLGATPIINDVDFLIAMQTDAPE